MDGPGTGRVEAAVAAGRRADALRASGRREHDDDITLPYSPAEEHKSGDTVVTASGRRLRVPRRPNDMLYVELDGNANAEGARS